MRLPYTYTPHLFHQLLVFNEIRYNRMNTMLLRFYVVSTGSQNIRLLPKKKHMNQNSEKSAICQD